MTTLRRSVLAALLFTGSAVLGSGTTGCSDTNAQGLITDAAGAAGAGGSHDGAAGGGGSAGASGGAAGGNLDGGGTG